MIVTIPNNTSNLLPSMPKWETDYRIKSVIAQFQNTSAGVILPLLRVRFGGSTTTKIFRVTYFVDVAATCTLFWSNCFVAGNPADVTSPPIQMAEIPNDLVIRENDAFQITDDTQAVTVLISNIAIDIEPLGPLRFKGKGASK